MQTFSHAGKIPTHAQIHLRIHRMRDDTRDAAHGVKRTKIYIILCKRRKMDIFAYSYYFSFCKMAILLLANRKHRMENERKKSTREIFLC